VAAQEEADQALTEAETRRERAELAVEPDDEGAT
jgi:hypothetical protein